MKRFKIAGHIVRVEYPGDMKLLTILPGFRTFEYDGEGEDVLTVKIDDGWMWETTGAETEIGQFDVGGCNHGVWRTANGCYRFEVSDNNGHMCARMEASENFSSTMVHLYDGTLAQQNFGLNNCMMMSFAFAVAEMNTILIHSSVIRCDGKGYLMTAPSGTGKSTHTRLWYDNIPGCDLMNDDNPVIRIVDGKPVVYGSPWSGKTPCYRNISAPIGAIVRIKQMPENSIRRLGTIEALTVLLPACSSMKWDARVYRGVCDGITEFIRTCPIWELGCLPDRDAAILCHDTVSKENS